MFSILRSTVGAQLITICSNGATWTLLCKTDPFFFSSGNGFNQKQFPIQQCQLPTSRRHSHGHQGGSELCCHVHGGLQEGTRLHVQAVTHHIPSIYWWYFHDMATWHSWTRAFLYTHEQLFPTHHFHYWTLRHGHCLSGDLSKTEQEGPHHGPLHKTHWLSQLSILQFSAPPKVQR